MYRYLLVAALLLASGGAVRGQEIFGAIQGVVSDETGAVIPGARITARNTGTGAASSTVSNQAGLYFLGELRPGVYELEASATGFSSLTRKGLSLRIEDRLRVEITLKVGQVTDKIEVTAESPLLQTENNTLGRVIEEDSIKQLPLSGRDAFALVLLVPGAQQRRDDELPRLSGGLARTGEYVLDGSSITTPRRGQLFTQPNLDAIQEFKVQTSGLSAEFGRTTGGVVNATLKSGTNSYHGNLFEFHRNSSINARNFFSATNPKLIQNQFGGMLGGPVVRDRLFFFVDTEELRTASESLSQLTLPTPQMKRGDFSQLLGGAVATDPLGNAVGRNQIYDPGSTRRLADGRFVRDPFPGNIIPSGRFDPAGAKVINLYPDPNLPGLAQNFRRLVPVHTNNNKFDVRIDERPGARDQLFGRVSWDHQDSQSARAFPAAGTAGNNGNFNRYLTGAIGWTHTLRPTTLNDLRFSSFRGVQQRLLNLQAGDTLGIPNLNLVGLPNFTVPGYSGLGDAQAFNPVEEQYQIQDTVTLVRGRHVMKAGADFRRFRVNDLQLQFTGEYTLSAVQTAEPNNPGTTGNPLASLLLGQANQFNNSTLRGRLYYRSNYFGTFFQDDFKLTPALTLNIGVRYDVEQQPHESRSQGSNFDLGLGRVVTMKELGQNYIQNTDQNNFSPRVGLAWRPAALKNTVIRSHFGMFYVPLTGRATSGFDRFPADQRLGIGSDGLNAAVIISNTPPIVPSPDGKGFAHDNKNPNARTGYFEQWNFDLQHQAPHAILLTASYAGSAGHYLPMNQEWNVIPIDAVRRAGGSSQAMRPYADYGDILSHDERQNTSYHSLQLGLERRYRGGLFVSGSYTFSKMMDYNEDDFSSQFPMDGYNLALERGLSQSHFPHRFVAAFVYDLPFGKGKKMLGSGPVSWIVGNWQTSGILSLQTGQQVWITQPANTSRTFNLSFRPNLVNNPILETADRTLGRWFNTGAFQAPAPLFFGTSNKFPGIQGPGLSNFDYSMIRFIALPWREGMRVELRGDFFNIFNRTNFNEPVGTFGTPTFGQVTSARAARTIQLGLKLWF
ncbi:MAG TPA: TonB-dependent receptor [Bryobacteraceae bacterium]|nr:TonB-dependent receptor [Bryobacteraceae bacterium]